MRSGWRTFLVSSIGAIASTVVVAVAGLSSPLRRHLIIPSDAVIPMVGGCPSGWHTYDPIKGQYLVASTSPPLLAQGTHIWNEASPSARDPQDHRLRASSLYAGSRLVIPDQSIYVVLTLCQPREH